MRTSRKDTEDKGRGKTAGRRTSASLNDNWTWPYLLLLPKCVISNKQEGREPSQLFSPLHFDGSTVLWCASSISVHTALSVGKRAFGAGLKGLRRAACKRKRRTMIAILLYYLECINLITAPFSLGPPLGSVGDAERKLDELGWRLAWVKMDRRGGWGRSKSKLHKERGTEGDRRRGEINLLIFHGHLVIITTFAAP